MKRSLVIAVALTSSCTRSLSGPALSEFRAAPASYFPTYVKAFFSAASAYEVDYPSLQAASSDVRLIQVKPLSPNAAQVNEANLSWSADGAYLGFEVTENSQRKILLKDLVGDYSRELLVLPKGKDNFLEGLVVPSAHSYNAGLRWSRDSIRYAFMSNGGVGEYSIYVGAVGEKEVAIAKSSHKDGYASWSPKSGEIAFVSGRSGNGDIYVIDTSSQNLTRISNLPAVELFPEWFPKGDSVVFASGDALNHDIFVASREGAKWSAPRRLTDWKADELRPTVSPDGSMIAFYCNEPNNSEKIWNIHVLDAAGAQPTSSRSRESTIVARDVVIDLNTGPAWSPDSRKLFFVKRDPTAHNPIYAYDLFTGRTYMFKTGTKMNRDILMSTLGVLSFRAQVGVWDRVFVALTNQGLQLQNKTHVPSKINYLN